ncbi:hypothetical protein HDV01_006726 [Terramyces sp. JEL0728]|nr:hypothetical protein HDV01_006726 [Terramyces sp. JEL0728]
MTLEFIDNFNKQLQSEQERLKQRQQERNKQRGSYHCLKCIDFAPKSVDIDEIAKVVTQQPEKSIFLIPESWAVPSLQQKSESAVTITEDTPERPKSAKCTWFFILGASDIIPSLGVTWGF